MVQKIYLKYKTFLNFLEKYVILMQSQPQYLLFQEKYLKKNVFSENYYEGQPLEKNKLPKKA